jgi:hypothetical protein
MKQTAIEWLIKRYQDYGTLYYEDITKAKEMEEIQIISAYQQGCIDGYGFEPHYGNGKNYYRETFNK